METKKSVRVHFALWHSRDALRGTWVDVGRPHSRNCFTVNVHAVPAQKVSQLNVISSKKKPSFYFVGVL